MAQHQLHLTVNGVAHAIDVDPRTTLLDVLRDHLGLTGTKFGCMRGECGACTVHVGGKSVLACMALAPCMDGKTITTIEGVGETALGAKIQRSFIEHDAFQCGYCTSGQIMSAIDYVASGQPDSEVEIRDYMSGNLCRCGAYSGIVAAVQAAMKG
jgi:xanthine dehydrogenase YagT iron-sulfur-binding subunit